MAEFLELSPAEKQVLYLLSELKTVAEVSELTGRAETGVTALLYRARRREGCRSTMELVIRYMHEYRGVLDPVPEKMCHGPKLREANKEKAA